MLLGLKPSTAYQPQNMGVMCKTSTGLCRGSKCGCKAFGSKKSYALSHEYVYIQPQLSADIVTKMAYAARLYKMFPSNFSHAATLMSYTHILRTSTIVAVGILQLLHQLNVVLLRGRRSDLVFNSDLLPRIVLVLLLYVTSRISQTCSIYNQAY